MPKLSTADIRADVEDVLRKTHRGTDGTEPGYLSAYQILDRLPDGVRERLIEERGLPGKGAGVHYAAASLVSDSAEGILGIDITYLDARGLTFKVAGHVIEAGNRGLIGLYRLP